MAGTLARLTIACTAVALPHSAMASLGGNGNTINGDAATMRVQSHVSVASTGGTLHKLTLGNGGEVREYASAAGVVYAVRWTGPGKPALDALLGVHFATFQTENPIARRHGLRRPPMVNRADLRVVTGGHPGAFWGYAWLPQSVPNGFDPASL